MAAVTRRLLLAATHAISVQGLLRPHVAHLSRQGYRIAVASAPGPGLTAVAAESDATVFPIRMRREISPASDVLALMGFVKAIRSFRPDLVSAGTPKAGLLGMLAARVTRTRGRVYVLRGLRLETVGGVQRLVLAAAERTAAACAQRIVCVSESLRERAISLGLASRPKTVVLGRGSSMGVDIERYHPRSDDAPDVQQLRRELGLNQGEPVVGFVGRFTRDKGVEDLLSAFSCPVLAVVPNARLLLLGVFEEGDPISPRARESLHTNSRITLAGLVENAAPYYALMDVLAFPSYREGFPNVPLEAAASGIPSVAYATTGSVDAVEDGVTGTLVTPGDSVELGRAICRYLTNRELRTRHGGAGRERVVQDFRREAVLVAWERFYAGLLESGN